MNELLRIDDLQVSFDTKKGGLYAVRGVSLTLMKGETLALVGESGCGKSVTARSILHLNPTPPSRIINGNIQLFGQDVTNASEQVMNAIRGKEIGMVFQDPMSSLNPSLKIWEQVTDGLRRHHRRSVSQCRKEAVELLRMVQVPEPEERIWQYPHQLSGGMRQRVMIAMALACKPQILIADEPTTALDVTVQAEILSLLKQLKQQLQMSTLLITHDLAVAANTAERIVVMYAGRVVETGPVSEVFSAPAHPYTRALFQSHPASWGGGEQELPFITGSLPDPTKPVKGCAFAPRCISCMKKCRQEEPLRRALSHTHEVYCFLREKGAVPSKEGTQ